MASRIAQGDWLPDGAFTVNSPLYPYILALLYKVFGNGSYFAVRLVGAAIDSGTCVLAAILACRHFGAVAGWGTGLLLAVYGPMVFFATDLTPVPYTLFLLTSVLLAGLLALLVPWARRLPGSAKLTAAVAGPVRSGSRRVCSERRSGRRRVIGRSP